MSRVGPASCPDRVDGHFLSGFLKVCLGGGFRVCTALFSRQIVKPEAENKEHRNG